MAAGEARAALTTGTTGFPLPLTVGPTFIMTGSGALNPVMALANVITIGTHDWAGVSSDRVTAAYAQEGTEATDATPTVAGPKISTQQGRAFVQFTSASACALPCSSTAGARSMAVTCAVCRASVRPRWAAPAATSRTW